MMEACGCDGGEMGWRWKDVMVEVCGCDGGEMGM